MIVGFLAALAAAIVFLTFVQTAAAYPNLPQTIALHFNWRGEADGFGRKWTIWFIPILMLFIGGMMVFSGNAIATNAPGTHGSLPGLAVLAVCVAVLMWRVQSMIIECAKGGAKQAPMRGFWAFFAVWMCVVLFDAFVSR